MRIRDARRGDEEELTALALRSKAHWGYDDEFLERARPELEVTAVDLERLAIGVAEAGGPIGFYAIEVDGERAELRAMFVDPPRIGEGVGAALFAAALDAAREAGVTTLVIESDPNAEAFYRSRGAVRVGERVSPSTGRALPLLELRLQRSQDRHTAVTSR